MSVAIRRLLGTLTLTGFASMCGADTGQALAVTGPTPSPVISIVIDDLGDRLEEGVRALQLPGPVAVSLLPHTPYAQQLAATATVLGKEVILHLPMEPKGDKAPGAGALTAAMTEAEFKHTLRTDLAAVPNVIGVSNHMGSLLTGLPDRMQWLMSELGQHDGLLFIDSRTVIDSVAYKIAGEYGLPRLQRDIFLDSDPSPDNVRRQFRNLVARARRLGGALAIGHPYPATLTVLEEELPRLTRSARGVELVPVSRLLALGEAGAPGPRHAAFVTVNPRADQVRQADPFHAPALK